MGKCKSKVILGWIRNNVVTLVEAGKLAYNGLELIACGIARLIPGDKIIRFVNDTLEKGDQIFKDIKGWLLKHNF